FVVDAPRPCRMRFIRFEQCKARRDDPLCQTCRNFAAIGISGVRTALTAPDGYASSRSIRGSPAVVEAAQLEKIAKAIMLGDVSGGGGQNWLGRRRALLAVGSFIRRIGGNCRQRSGTKRREENCSRPCHETLLCGLEPVCRPDRSSARAAHVIAVRAFPFART